MKLVKSRYTDIKVKDEMVGKVDVTTFGKNGVIRTEAGSQTEAA